MLEYRDSVTILHTAILFRKQNCWIIIVFEIYYVKMQEADDNSIILFSEKSILNPCDIHHSRENKWYFTKRCSWVNLQCQKIWDWNEMNTIRERMICFVLSPNHSALCMNLHQGFLHCILMGCIKSHDTFIPILITVRK